MQIHLGTMVYLVDGETGANVRRGDASGYVTQAATLAKTLRTVGDLGLTVYTNQVDVVRDRLAELLPGELRPDVTLLEPTRREPPRVGFFATPYKLDVLRALATRADADDLVMMLDADIAMIRPLDPYVLDEIRRSGLGLYDITEQVMSHFSPEVVGQELDLLAGTALRGARWVGGECYAGTPEAVLRLVGLAEETYGTYVEHVESLHHHGEEGFVSAAANRLALDGQPFVDVGARQLVTRHWSGVPYKSVRWAAESSLVHLPGNKALLERQADSSTFQPDAFKRSLYRAQAVGRTKWAALRATGRVGRS